MTLAAMSSAVRGDFSISWRAVAPIAVSAPWIESARLVLKNEGQTTDTLTPYGLSSWRSVSESATTPAFTVLYELIIGGCTSPAAEAVLTICPEPWRLNSGVNARQPRTTPIRLMSMTRSHSSSDSTSIRPPVAIPALFTRMSSPPQFSSHHATAASQSAASRTFNCRYSVAPCPCDVSGNICAQHLVAVSNELLDQGGAEPTRATGDENPAHFDSSCLSTCC